MYWGIVACVLFALSVSAQTVTLDSESPAPQVQYTGTWTLARLASAAGGSYRYGSGAGVNTCIVTPVLMAQTPYQRILLRWVAYSNRSKRAVVRVYPKTAPELAYYQADFTSEVRIDQTRGGQQWHDVGIYYFPQGSRVEISDAQGKYVTMDAIRFEPVIRQQQAQTPQPAPAPQR